MYSLHDKIQACWTGKCLAGAIGMAYEGVPYLPHMTEDQIHVANVPNDDLELQLVWMETLRKYGVRVTSREMAETWLKLIPHGCDEYSVALRNMKRGIMPPASGWKDNFFVDGMGATIRSEVWALIFAGRPDAVAYFAQQDAEVDHWGDGVRGEIFMALAENFAIETSDVEISLRRALEQMDHESRIYRTLAEVFDLYDRGVGDTEAANHLLLTVQRHPNFTDCVMNLAFIVHALLRGKGDFVKTCLMTINFGRDTDCTAASCGAFLGMAHGMAGIPESMRKLVQDELVLSDFVAVIPGTAKTITELVEQTVALREQLYPLLPAEKYPAYTPYVPDHSLPSLDRAKWLVIDAAEHDVAAIQDILMKTGKCPENLQKYVVTFDGLNLDLSRFANRANQLHLFSFLTVENTDTPPDGVIISATADTGMRLFMDDIQLMNHHSRQKMLPSFHRAEGGGAFHLKLDRGRKYLFHAELFYCLAPLSACIMFGNRYNDHLDGFVFNI